MKNSNFLILLFTVLFFIAPLNGHAFWFGEETLEEMGYEYETCDDLDAIAGQLQRDMRGFNNNPDGDAGITINKSDSSWQGVTLLSCVGGCTHPSQGDTVFRALLIDNQGNFVNGWTNINAIPAKLLPGGYIMGGKGGGFGGTHVVIQDWCGNEVWAWELPGGTRWHHDHNRKNSPSGDYVTSPGLQPLMDAKSLVLGNHVPENEYEYPKQWVPEGHPAYDTSDVSDTYGLIDDAIYEVDKQGRIKWQWFASQHVDEMGFNLQQRQAINDTNVGRGGNTDWTHFNNVNWIGENTLGDPRFHEDNLIFDSRTSGMIGIIAHDDNPGLWQKGEIIWKIGPGEHVFNTDGDDLGPIIGPHNAHFITKNPGAGNIIVFDNGGQSGYGVRDYDSVEGCTPTNPNNLRDYSRVLEIDPTTKQVVWMYQNTEDFTDDDGNLNRKFFSTFISSMQRTPIGTTMITEGNQGRIFEVTPDGEIVWEYLSYARPGGPGVIGRALYRSYRYPASYVPTGMSCD